MKKSHNLALLILAISALVIGGCIPAPAVPVGALPAPSTAPSPVLSTALPPPTAVPAAGETAAVDDRPIVPAPPTDGSRPLAQIASLDRADRFSGPAAEWIDRASEAELARIIKEYGEERQARRIARTICRLRLQQPLETTADLRRAVEVTHPQRLTKTLARVFQAFRIVVNDELGQLDKGLDAVVEWLLPGGRLAVIAYHSLEDRLVKSKLADLVRGCVCPPKIPVCVCGRKPQFKKVQRKPLRAVEEEVRDNRRSRSAILRIYEKL